MSLESRLLTALSPWCAAPGWCVAFSGGLDSTVLLHLLVSLSRRMALPPLRAVHVAHGLQTAAAAWPAHCQQPVVQGMRVWGVITPSERPATATAILKTEQG